MKITDRLFMAAFSVIIDTTFQPKNIAKLLINMALSN